MKRRHVTILSVLSCLLCMGRAIRRRLDACLRWLLVRSPLFYLGAYVVLIVSFGGLYWSIAGQFYHPYVKYEQPMATEADTLRGLLTQSFRDAIRRSPLFGDGNSLDPEFSRVVSVRAGDTEKHINVVVWLRLQNKGGATTVLRLPIAVNNLMIPAPRGGAYACSFPTIDWKDSLPEPIARFYGGQDAVMKGIGASLESIELSQDAMQRIIAFNRAFEGFPSSIPGVPGRMFYLSAVTITTVGYGDIVPLSNLARTLTAFEATLGIVLLGLFVNSLWSLRQERDRGTPSQG